MIMILNTVYLILHSSLSFFCLFVSVSHTLLDCLSACMYLCLRIFVQIYFSLFIDFFLFISPLFLPLSRYNHLVLRLISYFTNFLTLFVFVISFIFFHSFHYAHTQSDNIIVIILYYLSSCSLMIFSVFL